MPRDNFLKNTITKLAERVGYLCSNPNCRTHTVGPNSVQTKSTRIGKAAHITAAAEGGPRFDKNLTPNQRSQITNGIWLCSNCSDLIDKDQDKYPTDLLHEWKAAAELEMNNKLKGGFEAVVTATEKPFLEVELIWTDGGRSQRGLSSRNPEEMHEGQLVRIVPAGGGIWHWELDWNYLFRIHNNSKNPAYNVRIEVNGETYFSSIEKLDKVNNIQPYAYKQLYASFRKGFEGSGRDADELLKPRIPVELNGMVLEIIYFDESRNELRTKLVINDGEVINSKP